MEREGGSVEEIRFLEQPPVRGVSKQLVFDLYDIANKFSQVDPEASIAIFTSGDLGDNLNLRLTRSPNLENGTLLVSNGNNSSTEQGVTFIFTSIGSLMWDLSLSAREVKIAVAQIDAQALQAGLIDEQTGDRKHLPPETRIAKLPKFNVSEQFTKPGYARLVLPGEDPQKILSEYDDPDKLEVLDTPYGGSVIVLRDETHQAYREKRERIARDVLREKGISMEMIGELGYEEIIEFRKEIEKRITELEETEPNEN